MISDMDCDNICAHKLQLMSNMPHSTFNQMRYTFSHKLDLDSLYMTNRCLALLSGVTPVLIDCCVNSCIAYTQKYANYIDCPYYGELRRPINDLDANFPTYCWCHICEVSSRIPK